MRRVATALRFAARTAAAAWLAAALVAFGAGVGARTSREATARIEPLPLASEPVEAAQPAPAPRPPAASSEPLPVGAAEIARGGALLDEGSFPVLVASYSEFPSFRDYALAMQALGARLAVVRGRRIVGQVDLEGGEVAAGAAAGGAFSPRARDYTDEPGLAALADAARARFGAEAEVRMLVPREIDAGLFGGIAAALAREGGDPGTTRELRARYLRAPGGGVRLRVDAAVRRDGAELPLDALFDLGAIASAARAPTSSSGEIAGAAAPAAMRRRGAQSSETAF